MLYSVFPLFHANAKYMSVLAALVSEKKNYIGYTSRGRCSISVFPLFHANAKYMSVLAALVRARAW